MLAHAMAEEIVIVTEEDLLSVIEQEPELVDHGFGFHYKGRIRIYPCGVKSKKAFDKQREKLKNSFPEFELSCQWLSLCIKSRTINLNIGGSYHLKHMVEAWAKHNGKEQSYTSNGAFIAAAIYMGFNYRFTSIDSPNVYLNISSKSPIFGI